MDEKQLKEKLDSIRSNLRFFDDLVHTSFRDDNTAIINKRQADAVNELLNLFSSLNWQLALNSYKEIVNDDRPLFNKEGCGKLVRVRSCREGHGDKTYFGIYLGEMPTMIVHSIDKDGNLKAKKSAYNPAIFIPELNDIVYGCESWWGGIESEDDLQKLITDETIQNVWYMKVLNQARQDAERIIGELASNGI